MSMSETNLINKVARIFLLDAYLFQWQEEMPKMYGTIYYMIYVTCIFYSAYCTYNYMLYVICMITHALLNLIN